MGTRNPQTRGTRGGRVGAPSLTPGEKSKVIQIRIQPKLYEELAEAAQARGMSIASALRAGADGWMERNCPRRLIQKLVAAGLEPYALPSSKADRTARDLPPAVIAVAIPEGYIDGVIESLEGYWGTEPKVNVVPGHFIAWWPVAWPGELN